MRLIDADALGMDMWIQMGIVYGEDIGKAFADIVRNAPTIEAEQVVRCKDCKHRHEYRNSEYIDCDCTDFYEMDDDDYCCFGERKEP